ncbi:uncharacterized protein TrAFT101_005255 [Trichoderma asperellum]|uniref:uncharacterized protein n=1 Tax=Trichoderma asperellum TaxID=101201 RepID=UPI003325E333|nr:hypothetical protein TrAFT101_005255 [Trichoderma asperellum]
MTMTTARAPIKARALKRYSNRPKQWQQTVLPSRILGPGKLSTVRIRIRCYLLVYWVESDVLLGIDAELGWTPKPLVLIHFFFLRMLEEGYLLRFFFSKVV